MTNGSNTIPNNTLLVFFSRAGENLWNDGTRTLEKGNTHRLAEMIAERIECDVYEIVPAEPYAEDFATVDAASAKEMRDGARPTIAGEVPNVDKYDRIIVGSPVWHAELPMIMHTFFEATGGLAGKEVYPFVTFTGGSGAAFSVVENACPEANVHQGLGVRGEDVVDSVEDVEENLDAWVAIEYRGEDI